MKKVMFVSHKERQCGVHEYGLNTYNIIKDSTLYNIIYTEATSNSEVIEQLRKYPDLSLIIYNYYPGTMAWLNQSLLDERSKHVKQLIIKHETAVPRADGYIHIDPTQEEWLDSDGHHFNVGRPLLHYSGGYRNNPTIKFGSFGFGFGNKGFPEIVQKVNEEFDSAVIEFNIPFARFGDAAGKSARSIAEICRGIPIKPGIELRINHDFLDTISLLDFLASNDMNIFLYHYSYGRGISSVLDYALSVQRPLALTKSYQFKHIIDASPSIFVEDRGIKDILKDGTISLEPYYEKWSKENLIKDYEYIIERTIE
jgi:hypothetical protein